MTASARQRLHNAKIFLLRGPSQLAAAQAQLANMPLDDENPLELLIRERVKPRSHDANAYYWKRMSEIADQAWLNGRQYSKEVWHEYVRQNVLAEEVTLKDGTARSKWMESPSGKPVVISTSLLERKCFATFVEAVEAFGAGMGVQFSPNPNEGSRQ